MRAIDTYAPEQIEVLQLKGMLKMTTPKTQTDKQAGERTQKVIVSAHHHDEGCNNVTFVRDRGEDAERTADLLRQCGYRVDIYLRPPALPIPNSCEDDSPAPAASKEAKHQPLQEWKYGTFSDGHYICDTDNNVLFECLSKINGERAERFHNETANELERVKQQNLSLSIEAQSLRIDLGIAKGQVSELLAACKAAEKAFAAQMFHPDKYPRKDLRAAISSVEGNQ